MTRYNLKPTNPPTIVALDAKEQRRKVLEAARKLRQQNAMKRLEHERAAHKSNGEYREYVDYSG